MAFRCVEVWFFGVVTFLLLICWPPRLDAESKAPATLHQSESDSPSVQMWAGASLLWAVSPCPRMAGARVKSKQDLASYERIHARRRFEDKLLEGLHLI